MKKFLRITRHSIFLILMTMSAVQLSECNGNDNIVSVSSSDFATKVKADSAQLVDVRTPQEYADGHIDGALNIDIQSNDFQRMVEKELSKDSTILVYCRSGRRSMDAAVILTKLGYKVVNLKGGIIEWEEDGLRMTTGDREKYPL